MTKRMPKALYERELMSLQAELVDMQAWVQQTGARVVVIFEGRDAAGKGSTIKRVSEYMNPRVTRIVALPTPSARDKTRWYFQRYVPHLPAGGEIVSWTAPGTTGPASNGSQGSGSRRAPRRGIRP